MLDVHSGRRMDDTEPISAAEVTFDGSTSTVAGPGARWTEGPWKSPRPSSGSTKDVCMPTRVSIAGHRGEAQKIARVERRPSQMGSPGTSSCSPLAALHAASPADGCRVQGPGSGQGSAASPGARAAACNEAQQLRGEVLELRALLQRSKAAHADEAARLQFQVQDLEAALRHEHGLREDAERGERVANSQRDELQNDLDLLQQQLQVTRAGLRGGGASEGTSSPRRRLPGDDMLALGTEILQVRQDSQDLRGLLLTRQHEAELRRLRGDLAETERAARAAQAALREAEDAHELRLSNETATLRRLETRCRFLEHGAEAAEAELATTSQQLVALEASRKKLERDLAREEEAGRHAQAERDAAAEDNAQTKDELEQIARKSQRDLKALKWRFDELMADRDQTLEKVASMESSLKSADLRQAVECACYWTEQDAARAAEVRAASSEEQALSLRRSIYHLEAELGHQQGLALVPGGTTATARGLWGLSGKLSQVLALLDASTLEEGLRRLREECDNLKVRLPSSGPLRGSAEPVDLHLADHDLRQQYAAAESKVGQLQDAVAFLTQRVALGAAAEAKAGDAQDMLKKDLHRYEALQASSEEQRRRHVRDKSKLSELEMLMQGCETEQEALHGSLETSRTWALALESKVAQEEMENCRLRSEIQSSERQAEKLQRRSQRLDLELTQLGSDRNTFMERHADSETRAQELRAAAAVEERQAEAEIRKLLEQLHQETSSAAASAACLAGANQSLEKARRELQDLRSEHQVEVAQFVSAKVQWQSAVESLEAGGKQQAQLHSELNDVKLRFCNLQAENAAEKTESMSARGALQQLQSQLDASMLSERRLAVECNARAESLRSMQTGTEALMGSLREAEAKMEFISEDRLSQSAKAFAVQAEVEDLQKSLVGLKEEHQSVLSQQQVERAQSAELACLVEEWSDQEREVRQAQAKWAEVSAAQHAELEAQLAQRGENSAAEVRKVQQQLEACRKEMQAEQRELDVLEAQLHSAGAARDHAVENFSASEADLTTQKVLVVRLEARLSEMEEAWEEHAQRLALANAKARRLEDALDAQARELQQQVSKYQLEEELCRKLTSACAGVEDQAFQQRQHAESLKSEAAAQRAAADRREADLQSLAKLLEEARSEFGEQRASCLRQQATISELQHVQQEVADVRAEAGTRIASLENEGRHLALECAELRATLRDAEGEHGRERQTLEAQHAELERSSALHQSAAAQSGKQREALSKQLLQLQEEAQEQQYQLAGMARQEAAQKHKSTLALQELTAELQQSAQRGDRAEAALADALAKGTAMLKQNQGLLRDHEEKDAAAEERSTKLQSTLNQVQDALAQSQAAASQHREDADTWKKAHDKLQEDLAAVKIRYRTAELQLQENQGELQVCQSGKERAELGIRRLQEQVGKASEELASLQQSHDQKESDLAASEMRLAELQLRADRVARERTELEAELQKARAEVQRNAAEVQSLLQQKSFEAAELRNARGEGQAQQQQLSILHKELEDTQLKCRGMEQALAERTSQLQSLSEQRREWNLKREYQERAILSLEEQVCSLNEEMSQANNRLQDQQTKQRSAERRVLDMEQTAQVMAKKQDKALDVYASKEEAAAARLVQLEASLSQLRSQLALRESEASHNERQAESTAARVKVLEAKDAACGKRTAVAEARAAELESKLRQLHATSAHVQEQLARSRAEQLQLASEKSRLEDQCASCQRRLVEAEAQMREAQAEREHWKSQLKIQEDRAAQWEAKVSELMRELHKLQSEGQPLPLHGMGGAEPEVGSFLRQIQASPVRNNAVQTCLLAAHGKLEESYLEAQRRLVAAEERLQELREECAYGSPTQLSERTIAPIPEEPIVEPVVGNAWQAQAQEELRARTAELSDLAKQNDALLAENQSYKVSQVAFETKTMKLEASVQRLRGDVEQMNAELQEAQGRLIHAEGAARRAEAARQGDAGRSEAILSENLKLREEFSELEERCRGQSEEASEQLRSALGLEKRLVAVRQKHVRLQDAYREQGRARAKGVEEDSIDAFQTAADELKEELSQLREEAAAERANREHADQLQENVEQAVKRLHSEELQGFQSEQHALRVALQEQRRQSTEALEAQRWAVRKEKQLRRQRYALLLAASEELRFALQRLRSATEDAALADETTEDQDRKVTEELDEVKFSQQELQASRALEQERLQDFEEVQQQLKEERRSSTQNEDRLRDLVLSESQTRAALEQQEAAVVADKRRLNAAYRQLEEAHAEERSSREKAEDFHQQVAAETQLLAVELLKLQGAFEEDGQQSESNFSSMSRFGGSRLLVEVASGSESSEEDESPDSQQDGGGRAVQQALSNI